MMFPETGIRHKVALWAMAMALAAAAFGQEGWTTYTISDATDHDFSKIDFVSETTGFAVGGGVIAKTTDGGSSWNWVMSTTPGKTNRYLTSGARVAGDLNALIGLDFVDAQTGYAVGLAVRDSLPQGGIIKTSDGGATWESQSTGAIQSILAGVHFKTADVGYAVGTNGKVLRTTNGGQNWVECLTLRTTGLAAVQTIDANTAVVVGDSGVILKTTNGGANWARKATGLTTKTLQSLSFPTASVGFAVGIGGVILKTSDGGETWASAVNASLPNLYGVDFLDASFGFVSGNGIVLVTANGGASWSYRNINGNILYSVKVVNDFVAYLGGDGNTNNFGSIYKTQDGGSNWTPMPSTTFIRDFSATYFSSQTEGYATAALGGLMRTRDGGKSWKSMPTGTTRNLTAVQATGNGSIYAAGEYRTLLKSTDSGETWSPLVTESSTQDLFGLHFTGNTTGYAVGSGGNILKTTNSGAAWNSSNCGVSSTLWAVHFPTATTGYAVGNSGTICKTTDGSNWSSVASGVTSALRSVYFTSENTGYVTGLSGVIRKTTDGGATWSPQANGGVTANLHSIRFSGTDTGYVAGAGVLLRTVNAGATRWEAQVFGNDHDLRSVYTLDGSHAYAVGYGGTVLKTVNAGVPPVAIARGEGGTVRASQTPFEAFIRGGDLVLTLAQPSRVRVSLFDSRGRLVSRVHEGTEVSGRHSFKLPAIGAGKGPCFLEVRADRYARTIYYTGK